MAEVHPPGDQHEPCSRQNPIQDEKLEAKRITVKPLLRELADKEADGRRNQGDNGRQVVANFPAGEQT